MLLRVKYAWNIYRYKYLCRGHPRLAIYCKFISQDEILVNRLSTQEATYNPTTPITCPRSAQVKNKHVYTNGLL